MRSLRYHTKLPQISLRFLLFYTVLFSLLDNVPRQENISVQKLRKRNREYGIIVAIKQRLLNGNLSLVPNNNLAQLVVVILKQSIITF